MEILERGRETRIFTGKSSYSKEDKRVAATGVKGREEMRSSQGGGGADGATEEQEQQPEKTEQEQE
jgi:hypothetical protein